MAVVLLVAACGGPRHPSRTVVLWAWERPEDLRFLAGRDHVAVAWLAGTVRIGEDQATARPRMQPLALPTDVPSFPVVRVETVAPPPRWDDESRADTRRAVERLVRLADATTGLQVDFDVPASGRAFYAALLDDLRRALPAAAPLEMTALASWCLGDGWIAGLPVSAAVPMLFRMGPAAADVERRLPSLDDWPVAPCRGTVGLATDEPARWTRGAARVYVFSTAPWTESTFEAVWERLHR